MVGLSPEESAQAEAEGWTEILARFQPDLVHFGSATSARFRCLVPDGLPVVATIHGNDLTNARPRAGSQVDRTPLVVDALNACDHVFPNSQHTAELAQRWGITAPLTVMNPRCDIDFFQPRPALGERTRAALQTPAQTPLLLTVSRLVARKGHFNILKAIAELQFRVRWVIVGDGHCRENLEAAVADYGLSEDVQFLGDVADDDLLSVYNACDLFVLTPKEIRLGGWVDTEGFGIAFHEAGACGKPVIASAVSGCQEAVIDGTTGLLVPAQDSRALAGAIKTLLLAPETAHALGQNGLDWVRAGGGWSQLAAELIDEYHRIMATYETEQAPRRAANVD
jgi:phosphatidylinositol alpha-1,6-mannosyltransferase